MSILVPGGKDENDQVCSQVDEEKLKRQVLISNIKHTARYHFRDKHTPVREVNLSEDVLARLDDLPTGELQVLHQYLSEAIAEDSRQKLLTRRISVIVTAVALAATAVIVISSSDCFGHKNKSDADARKGWIIP